MTGSIYILLLQKFNVHEDVTEAEEVTAASAALALAVTNP